MRGRLLLADSVAGDERDLHALDWDFADAGSPDQIHSIHPYPAKFRPELPRQLISELSRPGDVVGDIFCGSGTTLIEATRLHRRAIGIDLNPVAVLIAKAKTARLSARDVEWLRTAAAKSVTWGAVADRRQTYESDASRPADKRIAFWFAPSVIEELAEIRRLCHEGPSEASRVAALTAMSSIIVRVSRQDSDTRYVRREKRYRSGDTFRLFGRAVSRYLAAKAANGLDSTGDAEVLQEDVLAAPAVPTMDLVVTSPPYPNAYSYHLYHATRLLWLGEDPATVRRHEIGTHRRYTNRTSVETAVAQFRGELATIFRWLRTAINPSSHVCFVVATSVIRGHLIDNAELVESAAAAEGFACEGRIVRRVAQQRKAFNPRIGRVKAETIVVIRAN